MCGQVLMIKYRGMIQEEHEAFHMKMRSKAALFAKNKQCLYAMPSANEATFKGQPKKTREAAVSRNTLPSTNLFSHFRFQKLERYL